MKKMKKVIRNLMAAAVILAIAAVIHIGNNVFNGSMLSVSPKNANHDKSKKYIEEKGFDLDGFKETYHVEKLSIKSSAYSHSIPASYILADGKTDNDTVILVHGLKDTRVAVFPVAEMFLERGYNVIAYDQRASGGNQSKFTTFGIWEKQDLADYVTYIRKKISPDKKVVLWGTSTGAETVGLYLGMSEADADVSCAILDSPVSSVKEYLAEKLKKLDTKTPSSVMLLCGNMITGIRLSVSYGDSDVTSVIKNTKVPVLIYNSKADTKAPAYMGQEIYDAIKSERKEIYTVEDSRHKEIFYDHRAEYEENVMNFIKE